MADGFLDLLEERTEAGITSRDLLDVDVVECTSESFDFIGADAELLVVALSWLLGTISCAAGVFCVLVVMLVLVVLVVVVLRIWMRLCDGALVELLMVVVGGCDIAVLLVLVLRVLLVVLLLVLVRLDGALVELVLVLGSCAVTLLLVLLLRVLLVMMLLVCVDSTLSELGRVFFVLVNMGNGNSKYRGDKKGSDDESGGDLNHDCIGFYKLKYVCKKKFERICDIEMKIGACDQRSDGWLDCKKNLRL